MLKYPLHELLSAYAYRGKRVKIKHEGSRMKPIQIAALLGVYWFTTHANLGATELLEGNSPQGSGTTMTFALKGHVRNSTGAIQYVSAAPTQAGMPDIGQYTISGLTPGDIKLVPLISEKTTIGLNPDLPNPLLNQPVRFLASMEGANAAARLDFKPLIVLESDPTRLYLIADVHNAGRLYITEPLNDAQDPAQVTSEIIAIEGSKDFAFAAVKPNGGGQFGDAGSGIAAVILGTQTRTSGEQEGVFPVFLQLDAPTGLAGRPDGVRAAALDVTSSQLAIGSPLASIGQVVDMAWSPQLRRLFIALRVEGGPGLVDGARALAVGRIVINEQDHKFFIEQFAPASLFDGAADQIVGETGSGASVSLHFVRSMFTSTAFSYLVVVGDVGLPADTKRRVYALPLTASENASLQGTLADKDAQPQTLYASDGAFVERYITKPATTPAEATRSTEPAAQVGAGELPFGDIADVCVYGDTVFVSVEDPAAGMGSDPDQIPGIFYSQAIFNPNGTIKAWTQWQRAVATSARTINSGFDALGGGISFIERTSVHGGDIVRRTVWGEGSATEGQGLLNQFALRYFAEPQGGVMGLFDLPVSTPGLATVSLNIFVGSARIAIAQTGLLQGSTFEFLYGNAFANSHEYTNGTIDAVVNAPIAGISGGVLDDLGPLCAAEVATDQTTNAWIFVGGINGLAVLSQADGAGFDPATGPGDQLSNLTPGFSFKFVSGFSQILKLVADGQYLYVLTLDSLERIDLTQGNPGLGIVQATTIATVASTLITHEKGSFLDCIISGKLALVGTSVGLMRNGNGTDISTATTIADAAWTMITIPEGAGPIVQLYPVTQSGRAQDITASEGGYFHALRGYYGKNQSQVNRFCVRALGLADDITDTTVEPLLDLFVKDVPSYFLNFGEFRNFFRTDGAYGLSALSKQFATPVCLTQLPALPPARTGERFVGVRSKKVPLNFGQATQINALMRNSASGSVSVAGDFAVRSLE